MNDTNIWAKEPPLIMTDHPYGVPHNERAEKLNGRFCYDGYHGSVRCLCFHWTNYSWYLVMPKVGKKHYSYTPAGMAAAKKEAAKTGKKVQNKKPKK